MKIKVKGGYESRNVEFDNGKGVFEFEVEKFDLKEVLKKCLMNEYGSEEECVKYWKEGMNVERENVDEIISYILEIFECDKKNEYWSGEFMMSEEGFVRIFVDGKMFVG